MATFGAPSHTHKRMDRTRFTAANKYFITMTSLSSP